MSSFALGVLLQPVTGIAQGILNVNSPASGFQDGSNWVDAYADLQDALDQAATPGRCTPEKPCEIWVAAGTYYPSKPIDPDDPRTITFELRNNVAIYGGFAGRETDRSQRDWDKNLTILDGDLLQNDDPTFEPTSNCCVTRLLEAGCDDQACVDAVVELEAERFPGRPPSCHLHWRSTCALFALNLGSSAELMGGFLRHGSGVRWAKPAGNRQILAKNGYRPRQAGLFPPPANPRIGIVGVGNRSKTAKSSRKRPFLPGGRHICTHEFC